MTEEAKAKLCLPQSTLYDLAHQQFGKAWGGSEVQARGCCRLREKANKTVCSKVITAINGELMQEGKQILSQDRYSEHFIIAQTLQPLSLCALWSQAVTKCLPWLLL